MDMFKQLKNTICENLIRFRRKRRLSQREVAAILTVKQPSYSNMEAGYTLINAVQLALLANFYEIPVQSFFVDGAAAVTDAPPADAHQQQLVIYQRLLDVYAKRIEELEARVKRRDIKIESLQDEILDRMREI